MKVTAILSLLAIGSASAFVPSTTPLALSRPTSSLSMGKYSTLEEIVNLFPAEKPVLINFFDVNTEAAIKDDVLRAKTMLADRLTLVSIKQQEYPEMAKLWECNAKSPSMILFKDGKPVKKFFEVIDPYDIASKVKEFCD